ncbi:uncharacterized protein LOC121268220 [Juglans microcarpa x Juglans regia]|uniref:uncharacterized protein LOC121268220 n=1 Tax=Juglans microcarpa x Juglans regia TaxID=2249226 RepID=UPI001B7DED2F|nr:uncharacterized protein LOC121268220 [Juglans microcarpa x Juglans regia]
MGNCCRSEHRSMVWAGDDWGSLMSKKEEETENTCNMKKQIRLLGDQNGAFGPPSPASSTRCITTSTSSNTAHVTCREVKIKITKKELVELLGRSVDVQGLSAKQAVLASSWLVHAADRRFNNVLAEHHRPWRPALQSIPEVN